MDELPFDLLFQNSMGANVVVDREFMIRRANDRFCQWTGYDRGELEGKMSLGAFVVPEEREEALKRFLRRKDGVSLPEVTEVRGVIRSGEVVPFRVRYIDVPGTDFSIYSVMDLRHEVAKAEINARYATLLEHCGAAIVVAEEDTTIVYVNQRWQDMFGYSSEEVVNKVKGLDLLTPVSRLDAEQRLKMRQTNNPGYEWMKMSPYQVIAKDGRILDVLANNCAVPGSAEVIFSAIDVTNERDLRERLLREELLGNVSVSLVDLVSANRMGLLKNIAEMVREGMKAGGCVITFQTTEKTEHWADDSDGATTDFLTILNAQVSRPLELCARANAEGAEPLLERMRGLGLDRVVVQTTSSQQGRTTISLQYEEPVDWGEAGWELLQSVTLVVANGLDRIEAERVRAANQRAVLNTQKLESIGEMAGGIAHDFNNMLAAIIGNGEMALKFLGDRSKCREYIQDLLSVSERAEQLVQDMMMFSRQSELKRRPVDLRTVMRETERLMRAVMPATITILTCAPPELKLVMGDPNQLLQVLVNLSTNAQQAMDGEKGLLLISLEEVKGRSHLRLDSTTEYVQVSVEDTGPGISEDAFDQIFAPFFTTKHVGEGTGMGLAVVHGIVSSLGGYIEAGNRDVGGAKFSLYLPVTDQVLEPQSVLEVETIQIEEPRSILLVDDEPAVLKITRKILAGVGFQVSAFEKGEMALLTFREHPEAFDLVITDMTMPGMSGIEVAEEIKAVRPDCPVVASTGYAAEGTNHPCIDRTLQKPFRTQVLIELIRDLVE